MSNSHNKKITYNTFAIASFRKTSSTISFASSALMSETPCTTYLNDDELRKPGAAPPWTTDVAMISPATLNSSFPRAAILTTGKPSRKSLLPICSTASVAKQKHKIQTIFKKQQILSQQTVPEKNSRLGPPSSTAGSPINVTLSMPF